MDVSKLHNFKTPLPTKGEVELEIVSVRELTGNKEDENGDVSTGLSFNYRIVGPQDVILNDEGHSSALGYTFDENFWFPRQSLRDSKPQTAARMEKDFARQLEAVFGKDFPDDVNVKDWESKHIFAKITTKYDDYSKDDIVQINERKGI